jgi:Calcineurin-like phosphoesterase
MFLRFPLLLLLAASLPAQTPFRFVAVGDTGSGSPAQQRVADQMWSWMQTHPFKLVVMLGDNIYGNHEISGGGSPRFFHDKFDLQYLRFEQAGVVFHATVGNHDRQTDHAQAEIDDVARFGILGKDGYYNYTSPKEFDVNGRPLIEFFCINSELRHEKEKQAAQTAWLDKALSQSRAVWKVVYLHHPLYTVRGQHSPAVELRELIRPAMEKNHVQIILAGHNHFYARMKPVNGALQLISGGGGRHLAFPFNDNCAVLSARKYHFVGAEVFPDKINFTAIDQYGDTFDTVSVDEQTLKDQTEGCPKR